MARVTRKVTSGKRQKKKEEEEEKKKEAEKSDTRLYMGDLASRQIAKNVADACEENGFLRRCLVGELKG